MGELRDFARSIGGILYGAAVLLAVGVGMSLCVMAWRWFAVAG